MADGLGLSAARYIVECYTPGLTAGQVEQTVVELRRSAAAHDPADGELAFLGAFLVASDEAAFHFFAAPSAEAVVALCERAELDFERVVETAAVGVYPEERLRERTKGGR